MRNRLAASIGDHTWDCLKQVWWEICIGEGKKLKHRYSNLVRAKLQRIPIVERGEPTSLLMRTYVNDLKLRLARLRTPTSTTASAYQARYLRSSLPEVLNYINSTRLGQMENRNSLSRQEITAFCEHFENKGMHELQCDLESVLNHPFLGNLPQLSSRITVVWLLL